MRSSARGTSGARSRRGTTSRRTRWGGGFEAARTGGGRLDAVRARSATGGGRALFPSGGSVSRATPSEAAALCFSLVRSAEASNGLVFDSCPAKMY